MLAKCEAEAMPTRIETVLDLGPGARLDRLRLTPPWSSQGLDLTGNVFKTE